METNKKLIARARTPEALRWEISRTLGVDPSRIAPRDLGWPPKAEAQYAELEVLSDDDEEEPLFVLPISREDSEWCAWMEPEDAEAPE